MSTIKVTTLSTADGAYSVPAETLARASCKAWVNFNGTGTVAIRRAFNVSSITDNGTGDYTVNFTAAMADANYSASSAASLAGSAATFVNAYSGAFAAVAPTTTAFRLQCSSHTSAAGKDAEYVTVAIFS